MPAEWMPSTHPRRCPAWTPPVDALVHNFGGDPQGTRERLFRTSECRCRVRQSRHETGSLGHRPIDTRGRRRSRRRDKGTATRSWCRGRNCCGQMCERWALAAFVAGGGAVVQRLSVSPAANCCGIGVRRATQHPHRECGVERPRLGPESTLERSSHPCAERDATGIPEVRAMRTHVADARGRIRARATMRSRNPERRRRHSGAPQAVPVHSLDRRDSPTGRGVTGRSGCRVGGGTKTIQRIDTAGDQGFGRKRSLRRRGGRSTPLPVERTATDDSQRSPLRRRRNVSRQSRRIRGRNLLRVGDRLARPSPLPDRPCENHGAPSSHAASRCDRGVTPAAGHPGQPSARARGSSRRLPTGSGPTPSEPCSSPECDVHRMNVPYRRFDCNKVTFIRFWVIQPDE